MNLKLLVVGAVVASGASFANAQGTSPFNTLKFDTNGFSASFYDAPGGSVGGGNVVPTLDPGGAHAASGASPFTGSIEFNANGALTIGAISGNNLGSLFGPWANAGEGGPFGAVGGFLNFQSGLTTGGEIFLANAIGDQLNASFDPAFAGELDFSFGSYKMFSELDSISFDDALNDGMYGDPGTGADISKFIGISASGIFQVPLMSPDGVFVDWEVVGTIPAPGGAIVLGAGLMLAGRRRRS